MYKDTIYLLEYLADPTYNGDVVKLLGRPVLYKSANLWNPFPVGSTILDRIFSIFKWYKQYITTYPDNTE